jgi:hypothetical protein
MEMTAAGDIIDMRNTIAKSGSGRRISMHPSLRQALADLFARRVERGPTSRQNSGAAPIICDADDQRPSFAYRFFQRGWLLPIGSGSLIT